MLAKLQAASMTGRAAMTSLHKLKRHGRQERERGVDTAHGHHAVLYQLRLLDDDDNYSLYLEMMDEECTVGDIISAEQWGKYMRWHDQPTLLHRLEVLNMRLRSTPPRLCARLVESFVRREYGRLEEGQGIG